MRSLKVFVCGPLDVDADMARVRETITRLNGSISYLVEASLDVHYWSLEESGLEAQRRIFREIATADLVIFLFYRRLGRITPQEFDTALKSHLAAGRPTLKVWFKYVPSAFEIDAGRELRRLMKFKDSLGKLPPDGLVYHTYCSDDPIAAPFADNACLPALETLVFQEMTPFLLRTTGLLDAVISDSKRLPSKDGVTKEMIRNHWAERARRPGVAAVMSVRYAPDEMQRASDQLVEFILAKVRKFVTRRSVIEYGGGIGRFTRPLSQLAEKLTVVEMCPQMIKRSQDLLGETEEHVEYIESFAEDLPILDMTFDCAISCLLCIHILDEDSLRRVIANMKANAQVVVLCEHVDETKQGVVSNFTRIWPLAQYHELFTPDFEPIASYGFSYLGDQLELMVFLRKPSALELSQRSQRLLDTAQLRSGNSFPNGWWEWYEPFRFAGLAFPYTHLLGSYVPGAYEFPIGQVETRRSSELEYDLPAELRAEEDLIVKRVVERIRDAGDYRPRNDLKVRIEAVAVRDIDPEDALPRKLRVDVQPLPYFKYLTVKEMLREPYGDFRRRFTAHRSASLTHLGELETTNIGGCGIYVLTQDHYVILSLREKVAEYPGILGYSASGSMNWYYPGTTQVEASPFITIIREAYEEMGVTLDVEPMRLYAIGIDLNAFFVQFSFFTRLPVTAAEAMIKWQNAVAMYEQVPLAVALTPEAISGILTKYVMEPSAAASLILLASKQLGCEKFEKQLRDSLLSQTSERQE